MGAWVMLHADVAKQIRVRVKGGGQKGQVGGLAAGGKGQQFTNRGEGVKAQRRTVGCVD